MELLLNNIHGLLVINLGESLVTLAHVNTGVKRKHNSIFSLVIESTNKNSKTLVDVMEKINVVQLEIEQHCLRTIITISRSTYTTLKQEIRECTK
jgi:hypothetical protein